jgi:hypothetical protein
MIIAVIRPTTIDRVVNSGDFEAVLAVAIGALRLMFSLTAKALRTIFFGILRNANC